MTELMPDKSVFPGDCTTDSSLCPAAALAINDRGTIAGVTYSALGHPSVPYLLIDRCGQQPPPNDNDGGTEPPPEEPVE